MPKPMESALTIRMDADSRRMLEALVQQQRDEVDSTASIARLIRGLIRREYNAMTASKYSASTTPQQR